MSAPLFPFCSVDWGHGKKFQYVLWEGNGNSTEGDRFTTLLELVAGLPLRYTVVLEKSFESFDLERRTQIILLHRERGLNMQCFSPRQTKSHKQQKNKKTDPESDKIDAWTIGFLYKNGLNTKSPKLKDEIIRPARTHVKEIIKVRSRQYPVENMKPVLALLPPADQVPVDLRQVLTKNKRDIRYEASYVFPLVQAALEASSRAEFDRLVGYCAEGHPNLLRSKFYHDAVKKLAGKPPNKEGKTYPQKMPLKQACNIARRAFRWVYHQVCVGHGQAVSRNGQTTSSAHTIAPGVTGYLFPDPPPPADL